MSKVYIGSHVSMKSPDFYLGSVKSAIAQGETTFMFYTGAPQNSFRLPLNQLKIPEALNLLKEHDFDLSKIVVHAPYLINLSNLANPDIYNLGKELLIKEMQRTSAMGVKLIVLHPGSHVKQGFDKGLEYLSKALNDILDNDNTGVTICIETMAGKGSEMGVNLEEISKIINSVRKKDQIGVCLDTCHLHDAGYELGNVDLFLDKVDEIIGLKYIKVIHINDSMNPIGAHKDRHENIGYGHIGFNIINDFVHNSRLSDIPKILETPWVGEKEPYKKEIEMLLSSTFEEGWREKL